MKNQKLKDALAYSCIQIYARVHYLLIVNLDNDFEESFHVHVSVALLKVTQ
jgi:hypothetical protein